MDVIPISYPDWMMAGVNATYWAVIGADKSDFNSPKRALWVDFSFS